MARRSDTSDTSERRDGRNQVGCNPGYFADFYPAYVACGSVGARKHEP